MSFTRAADELNLTQGAVSRQVRGLELALGVHLFELVRQRIVLTELGQRYHLEVRRTLDSLEHSTLKAMSLAEGGHLIDLATLPTFCSRWLIPKLPSFFAQHPGIALNCSSRFLPFDFAAEPFDAAIHFGAPAWPGGVLHQLFRERMVPVCAPEFAAAHDVQSDADLARAPLLQQSTRPQAWRDWFESAGVASVNAARGARFDQISMLTEAALAGLGAALLPEFLIEQELGRGRLIRLGAHTLETDNAYYLVVPEEKSAVRPLVQFRAWIVAQAARFRARARANTTAR
jgi:LysR family glycine cleavage system transcriptional activator